MNIASSAGWRGGLDFSRYSYGVNDACEDEETEASGALGAAAVGIATTGGIGGINCLYGDSGHCEGCPPETFSCFDHVAALHGLYNVVAGLRTPGRGEAAQGP